MARSLVRDPELRKALDEMGLRTLRHHVEYEAGDEVDENAVSVARAVAERVINLGAAHLREARPALRERIRTVKP